MADYKEQIKYLIDNPDELLQKKPFFRGVVDYSSLWNHTREVSINQTVRAELPKFKKKVISQQQFLEELDPQCHKVLFDQNVPSITMKLDNGSYVEIEYQKMAVSYQKNIKISRFFICVGMTCYLLLWKRSLLNNKLKTSLLLNNIGDYVIRMA